MLKLDDDLLALRGRTSRHTLQRSFRMRNWRNEPWLRCLLHQHFDRLLAVVILFFLFVPIIVLRILIIVISILVVSILIIVASVIFDLFLGLVVISILVIIILVIVAR